MRVAVARAAHERDGGEERPLAVRRHDLLRAEPVLDRHHRRARERPLEPRRERLEVGALAGEDRELGVRRQRRRIRGRVEPRREVAAPRDAEALLAQRGGVLLPPRQHGDLGDLREVRREKRADRAGAGYHDAGHCAEPNGPAQLGLAQSDHVESRHGAAEALERELADGDGFDRVLDLGVEPLRDQHLPARGFVRQPRGKVRHAADRGVVGAALEADLPARRVAESDACAEVELIAALAPQLDQADHLLAQRAAEPHRPQRRVGDLDRIVEEELDAVAFEEADGRLEALHEPADRVVELAQHPQQLLRLHPVDEARPAAQVGEEDRHLAAMAAEDRLVARGDDRLRDLRRQEPAELPHPLDLLDLRLHPLLQRPVQLLDRVVVALDAQKRAHAREQLVVVERLLDEVVGARLDRPRLVLADARRDHDHGQHRRGLVLA